MSKENDFFKDDIKSYLDNRAANDELFAKTYAKENKNLDECIDHITSVVVKQRVSCGSFDVTRTTREYVYGLAVHYYDEDDIKVEKLRNTRVAVSSPSTKVELTEEEKAAARERAVHAYEAMEQKKLEEERKKKLEKKREKAAQKEVQPSLFEF